jgi:chromosome segregation ATPase
MPNSLADISVFENTQNQTNQSMVSASPMSVFYADNSIQDIERLKKQRDESNKELAAFMHAHGDLTGNRKQLEKDIAAVDTKINSMKREIVQLESKVKESSIIRNKLVVDLDSCNKLIAKYKTLTIANLQLDNAVKAAMKTASAADQQIKTN